MKIAIVGATGNAGTAVLRELAKHQNVDSIIGIARRIPSRRLAPYDQADWHSVDIQFPESQHDLVAVFSGCDVVIHLAWLIQPNTDRELLRRVNVDGTRHVLAAAAEAGVPHIVVASSVGAYSPVTDDTLRDESWPTRGIPTSHYSVDKAAQERVMDEFQSNHPGVTVARLRPGLMFQASAGSEIQRYFLGAWVPVQLLRFGRPPLIPLPQDLRVQAVHTDDAARAYVLAAFKGVDGAFNICADDVLTPGRIGGVVTGNPRYGRVLPVANRVVRTVLKAAHRSGLLAVDEGWLDMAHQSPLMDTSRAKRDLGWTPTRSAATALEELIDGMTTGQGTPSAPMKPRRDDSTVPFVLPAEGHRLPATIDRFALRQYMADHLAGATAGHNRIQKLADAFRNTPVYGELASVADEIHLEHAYLQRLMMSQGFPRPGVAAPALWVAERVARMKSYAPGTLKVLPSVLVLETELMISAVNGKLHGWKTLANNASALGVPAETFQQLVADSQRQISTLQAVHHYARDRAFHTGPEDRSEPTLETP